jgi:hypothetical protein
LAPRCVGDFLGEEARRALDEGRALAFAKQGIVLDKDSEMRPAVAYYTGQPYATPGFRDQLLGAMDRGLHCLIVSGGYGLLRPEEPIHYYEAHMPTQTRSVWTRRLPMILRDYIERNGIRRTFTAVSNAYAQCLPARLGADHEWWSIPTFDPVHDSGSAMRVVPARIGESVAELLKNDVTPVGSWRPNR